MNEREPCIGRQDCCAGIGLDSATLSVKYNRLKKALVYLYFLVFSYVNLMELSAGWTFIPLGSKVSRRSIY